MRELTAGYLEDLKTIALSATPGPWEAAPSVNWDNRVLTADNKTVARKMSTEDTEFMATLNPELVLALIDEIERLRS